MAMRNRNDWMPNSPQIDQLPITMCPDHQEPVPSTSPGAPGDSIPTVAIDGAVYARALPRFVPVCLKVLGQAPWSSIHKGNLNHEWEGRGGLRQAWAMLALARLTQLDPAAHDTSYLCERVRAALIQWQCTLRADGRPRRWRDRGDPMVMARAATVVELLTDDPEFQTETLLTDLSRHLHWLADRVVMQPWLAATAASMLADAAVLVRESRWLATARRRLESLLTRQLDEGWFDDERPQNAIRMSLILDPLARMHERVAWPELAPVLQRAFDYLAHVLSAARDRRMGNDGSMLSPFCVEVMAPKLPVAARLAVIARRTMSPHRLDHVLSGGATIASWLAARVAQCASIPPGSQLTEGPPVASDAGQLLLGRAGLLIRRTPAYNAVVDLRRGGAVRVSWHHESVPLEDAGVVVVSALAMRIMGEAHEQWQMDGKDAITMEGTLMRLPDGDQEFPPFDRRIGKRFLLRRSVRGLAQRTVMPPRHVKAHRLSDHVCRRIEFGEDWVRIHDSVDCHLPCQSVVCQVASTDAAWGIGAGQRAASSSRPPLFIEGGRHLSIVRMYRNGVLEGGQPTVTRK